MADAVLAMELELELELVLWLGQDGSEQPAKGVASATAASELQQTAAPQTTANRQIDKSTNRVTEVSALGISCQLAYVSVVQSESTAVIGWAHADADAAVDIQDLAQAHKIWQQLTASNEYIATTESEPAALAAAGVGAEGEVEAIPTDEPPFYYHVVSRSQGELRLAADVEEPEKLSLKTTAVLHIESVYSHLDAQAESDANGNVIGRALTGTAYATCQEFLLHELAQTLDEYQANAPTSCPPDNSHAPKALWQLPDSDIQHELRFHGLHKVND
ncbi:hypothetical protein AWZ03_003233 [Drosophila navojoa]|uniref:Uncharacterized protein n=1 Tax=Drosophila navojoa TaxID=7232 RepID=A0A484BNK4_DRONA|nr:hypothetical protein AWZ03_003233 [Drosophila navojoa]